MNKLKFNIKLIYIIAIFSFYFHHSTPAQNLQNGKKNIILDLTVRELFYKGMISVYHFEFNDADRTAQKLIREYPTSAWGHLLIANIMWWRIITGENTREAKVRFFSELKLAGEGLGYLREDEKLYCQIVTNSLKSRYELLNKNYFSTLLLLAKSKNLMNRSEGKENIYESFVLTHGLFQYCVAAAKEKTGYLSYLLQFQTDKQQGLKELMRLSNSEDKVLRTESNYFLMKIYLEVENNPVLAKPYADFLLTWYPENTLFCYYDKRINLKIYGKSESNKGNSPCANSKIMNPQLTQNQINYLNSLSPQNN